MPNDQESKHILLGGYASGLLSKQHAGVEVMPNNRHDKHIYHLHWSIPRQPKRGVVMAQVGGQL
jgi:hypothetical protein